MTPTVEELREWSARLMGWKEKQKGYDWCYIIGPKHDRGDGYFVDTTIRIVDWTPDTNLNQAFMIVEPMRELGWAFHFNGRVENTDYGVGFAREYSVNQNLGLYKTAPGHAILLAAHATGEGQGIPDPEEK